MKLKLKGLIIIIISVIFIIALAAVFFASRLSYALKIDGERISVAEYRVYLYEQKKEFYSIGGEDIWETDFDGISAQDVAKQNAVNSIIYVKAAVNRAPELGIALSEEESKALRQRGMEYRDKIKQEAPSIDLSLKEAEKIVSEGLIQQKVYDFVTKGFEISPVDFEADFNEYYEENKAELNNVEISCIFMKADGDNIEEGEEKANALYERILNGEDFAVVQTDVSDEYECYRGEVKELNLSPEAADAAYDLKEGEVSRVILTDRGYYIIKAEKVETPDMQELENQYKETYTDNKKQEIYRSQLEKWAEKISVEKNERIFNGISVEEL